MRNYEQMTENVMKKYGEYRQTAKRRQRIALCAGSAGLCAVMAVAVGFMPAAQTEGLPSRIADTSAVLETSDMPSEQPGHTEEIIPGWDIETEQPQEQENIENQPQVTYLPQEPEITDDKSDEDHEPEQAQTAVPDEDSEPEQTELPEVPDEPEAETVEAERSYNEKIAAGEDVYIGTYVGEPYSLTDAAGRSYTYVLRNVFIGDRLPDGVSREDLSKSVGGAEEYSDSGVEKFSTDDGGRALDIGECIDENGLYSGPGNGYKWLFMTLDITNDSDSEQIRALGNLRLCGGEITDEKYVSEDMPGVFPCGIYRYCQELCYISEHSFDEIYYDMAFGGIEDRYPGLKEEILSEYADPEEYLREKFFSNLHFDPHETKTVVLGFPINNYFVYGDLLVEYNQGESDRSLYLPLK